MPLVAHDCHDAALGEDDREERHGARAGGHVEGVREQRVGAVEITVEQVGDAFGVQHGRPVRAGRAEPGHGELGVASHLRDPAATEQSLQVGQRGRHRVAVRQRSGGGITFGGGRPTFRLARPAEQRKINAACAAMAE